MEFKNLPEEERLIMQIIEVEKRSLSNLFLATMHMERATRLHNYQDKLIKKLAEIKVEEILKN